MIHLSFKLISDDSSVIQAHINPHELTGPAFASYSLCLRRGLRVCHQVQPQLAPPPPSPRLRKLQRLRHELLLATTQPALDLDTEVAK